MISDFLSAFVCAQAKWKDAAGWSGRGLISSDGQRDSAAGSIPRPSAPLIVVHTGTIRSRKFSGGIMPSSGLNGPYDLTSNGVANAVTRSSAGVYALGKTENGAFHIYYVGRSDSDVAGRLQQHVVKWYPQFKFDYFSSAKSAFEKECHLYHDFSPKDNDVHPARPRDTNWICPACRIFA